jgi:dihydropteroate synthase
MTKVMGIVNVTPDSFSDGGKYFRPEQAVARARHLIEDGADVIDLGGESTRPGAEPLSWETEWARLEPVIDALKGGRVPLSVDTYHPETAARAVAAGVSMINCVSSGAVPEMIGISDRNGCELVVPAKFLETAGWARFPSDVQASLLARIYLDPMIGFGTTREEDFALLRSVSALAQRGRVLVGASRKRIVKKLTGEKVTGKNVGGNLGIALWCALQGACMVRVHDVKETVQAIRVMDALARGEAIGS